MHKHTEIRQAIANALQALVPAHARVVRNHRRIAAECGQLPIIHIEQVRHSTVEEDEDFETQAHELELNIEFIDFADELADERADLAASAIQGLLDGKTIAGADLRRQSTEFEPMPADEPLLVTTVTYLAYYDTE